LSTNNAISPADLVNQPVHVEIDQAEGGIRYIHGVVSHFIARGTQQVLTAYTAVVRPWFWFLSLWQDWPIFQNKKAPDIVEPIFSDCNLTNFTPKLFGSYPPRVYCVQYRESSMDFVSRLFVEEGIFYYFEHSALTLAQPAQGSAPQRCEQRGIHPRQAPEQA